MCLVGIWVLVPSVQGGLDRGIPRLYRHDVESFAWVLTYITITNIEYKGCTIAVSPVEDIEFWFKAEESSRGLHILLLCSITLTVRVLLTLRLFTCVCTC